MAQTQKQTKQKGGGLFFASIAVIALIIGSYWLYTKDSSSDTFSIKSTNGDHFFKEKQYINLMGKEAESKRIELSEDYWESGKFDF